MVAINQHYIPRFLLNKFSRRDGKKRLIYCYDTELDREFRISPSKAARVSGFYDFKNDGVVFSVEDQFSKIEHFASLAIAKLIEDQDSFVSTDFFDALEHFAATLWCRTVGAERKIGDGFGLMIAEHLRDNPHIEELSEDEVKSHRRALFLQTIELVGAIAADVMLKGRWQIIWSDYPIQWISDNPVFAWSPPGFPREQFTHTDFYLPVSPNITLVNRSDRDADEPLDGFEELVANDRRSPVMLLKPMDVVELNRAQVIASERFVFGRDSVESGVKMIRGDRPKAQKASSLKVEASDSLSRRGLALEYLKNFSHLEVVRRCLGDEAA